MTEQFEEMMRKTSRNINVGYVSALFDTAIEYIGKIAVDERIPNPIHKTINPMLDGMIRQLHSMKHNTMATIMLESDEKTKVVQPEEKESERMTIWVHWDEYDDLECWGETQCCASWEEAVEYMKKQGKKKYEIEVEE